MKRSLIPSMIFSILILTACLSPRSGGASTPTMASAPSETPSPTATETPSPESLLPQEVKEKFELAGVDLADMQNAKYDKDGLHITLPGGEVIVLTNDQLQKGIYNGQDNVLQYRDEANQNVIYAFDKETSNWGVNESKAVLQTRADFEKYGYDFDGYKVIEDGENISVVDPETNEVIYENGEFDLEFAVLNLDPDKLVATNYQPKAESRVGFPNRPTDYTTNEYVFPIVKQVRNQMLDRFNINPSITKNSYLPLMLDIEKLAYGGVYDVDESSHGEEFLFYENTRGELVIVPLMPGSFGEVIYFWAK